MPARSAATARRPVPPAACGPTQACCWGPRTIFENTILACPSVARRGGAAASLFAQTSPLFKRKSTSPQTSLGVRRKLAFPCQRMAHDAFQVVEMRLPFEHSAGAVGIRHDPWGVSPPPRGDLDLEIDPRDAFDRVDPLEHGKAAAVTAIERDGGAARAQMGQGIGMRAHEVADVNIVADASAVWRRIIGAEDLDDRPQADRGFHCDLDEVSGSFGRLTDTAERVGARDVELTQDYVAQAMGAGRVAQHDLGHELGGAIWRGRHRRIVFAHRYPFGIAIDRGG